MKYYVFVALAIIIHLIINFDTLRRKRSEAVFGLRAFKLFLTAILLFYITDLLWGIFDELKLALPLYIDTIVYYVMMGLTVYFWTRFETTFTDSNKTLSTAFKIVGLAFLLAEITLLTVNIFNPILFEVDDTAKYITHPARDIMLWIQIALYMMTFIYSLVVTFKSNSKMRRRYLATAAFAFSCAGLIFAQLFDPYLPLYSMGILIGICILHVFLVSDVRHEYKSALDESTEKVKMQEKALDSAISLVRTDPLTGVKSRHAFVEVEQHFDRLINNKECKNFAVIVCDLNGLKKINDTKGHDAGDTYIQESVKVISDFFPFENIYRFGGDEFIVILEGKDAENRTKLHNAFMDKIDENARSESGPVVSSGISHFREESDNTFRAVFQRADKMMYSRKELLKERR
jgi:diguanylate cyclase (GGDEF)-like protein